MEGMSTKESFNQRVDWFLEAVKQIESDSFGLDKKRQFDAMEEIKNRFLNAINKNIEEIVRDENMHDALMTSMQYWQSSIFNRHAMPTLKAVADECNLNEKDLGDLVYDIQLSLHENKEKPMTYDLYMRSVKEVAEYLSIEKGLTIQ